MLCDNPHPQQCFVPKSTPSRHRWYAVYPHPPASACLHSWYACNCPSTANVHYLHCPCNSSMTSIILSYNSCLTLNCCAMSSACCSGLRPLVVLHRSQYMLSVLMQSLPLPLPSKYSLNTFRRHVRASINTVIASSSIASTEYALNLSVRYRMPCIPTMIIDSLTSPFRPPRPDCCTKLVNPYGRST